MKTNLSIAIAAGLLAATASTQAFAWGATGHYDISYTAMTLLPQDQLPAFLFAPEVAEMVGELGVEADRMKGSGQTHDFELNPGHYVDLDDAGRIMGGPTLAELPAMISRRDYDTALRAAGTNQYTAGYLPFVLVGGFQQLREDFARYRGLVAAQEHDTPEQAARYALEQRVLEMLIIHDIGIWSHYVGDTTMPLHTSVHFDAWGNYPNPNGYNMEGGLHARFEGAFVRANITAEEVAAAVPAPGTPNADIWQEVIAYIGTSNAQVIPMWDLDKSGAFDVAADAPAAEAFILGQMADAVAELRDLIVLAWEQSATEPFGYPNITVQEIEGGADAFGATFGLD